MKIITLHFKNVNSLAGEWTLRFDDPAFLRNHLFAIAGPTGSGKTSILDAISLALYGKTPRQDSVADKTKLDNGPELVMTLGTGESFSEVEFESAGNRYKAIWKVHRAGNKPDGKMQSPEVKLLFEKDGEYIAHDEVSKTKEVQKKIEEIVGLNFDQFMRAVMLPQGGFDNFLKSKREEKAAILEKLSGQEIYRKISKAVFARNKEEQGKLDSIQENLNGIQLMPDNEARDLEAWLGEAEKTKVTKSAELKKNEEYKRTLEDIEKAEKNCQNLRKEAALLGEKNRQLDGDRRRVQRSDEAQTLVAPLKVVENLRKDFAEKMKQKKALQEQMPQKKQACETAKNDLDKRTQEEENLRSEDKNRNALRDSVSSLDAEIRQLKASFEEKKTAISSKEKDIKNLYQTGETYKEKRATLEKKLADCRNYEKTNSVHSTLESEQSIISDRLNRLDDAKIALGKSQDSLAKMKTRCVNAEKDLKQQELKFTQIAAEREKNLSKDINKIASLIQSSLHEGEACPVCGSTYHDNHEGAIASATEISATANRLNHLQKDFEAAQESVKAADYELKRAKDLVADAEKDVQTKTGDVSELMNIVFEKLKIYGFSESDLNSPQVVLERIKKWASNWKSCKDRIASDENQLQILDEQEKLLQEQIEKAQQDLDLLNKDLLGLKNALQDKSAERGKLFGSRDVAEDRKEYQTKIDTAEKNRTQANTQSTEAENALAAAQAQLQTIVEQLNLTERDKSHAETDLAAQLRKHSFASEEDLRHALIPDLEKQQMVQQYEKVAADLATAKGQLNQAETNLNELRSRDTGHTTLQTATSKIEVLQKELDDLNKNYTEKSQKFAVNQSEKKKSRDLSEKKAKQEEVTFLWNTMNSLIGSADGKTFVAYVQQLTLSRLVQAANKHLKSLDPRYTIETENNSLNILLYDSECGERRFAANLSGGETFLVSLSLALGLSSLASQRVRIDTLFLDEGFGSLDERKLQRAIEVLRNLGESNEKLIGVISHVNRVQEEITNHFEIIPTGNGHSCIEGPGVN